VQGIDRRRWGSLQPQPDGEAAVPSLTSRPIWPPIFQEQS
jgi:hypothetical protein